MIPITPNMRLLVAIEPVDGRKGIDGLVHLCRSAFSCDPMEDGTLVVVRNRAATSIRLLAFDGQGWWLAQNHSSSYYTSFNRINESCVYAVFSWLPRAPD